MEANTITKKETLSFMSYSFGQTMSMVYTLTLLSIFYTDVLGISPAMVATLYLVARIWDAVNDPLMGIVVDKVHLKGGKFLPWLKFTAWALPISTVLLFVNLDISANFKVVYAFISYIVWGMIYTVSDVPACAVPTVMTNSLKERNSLIAKRMFGSALGLFIVLPVPALVESVGWLNLAVIYSLVMVITMIFVRNNVKERVRYHRQKTMSLVEILKYIGKNKYLLAFYIAYLLLNVSNTGTAMGTYFAKYNMGNLGLAAVISGVSTLPVIFIPLFMAKIIEKFGKRNILLFSMASATALSLVQFFVGYGAFPVFLLITAIKFVFLSTPILMLTMVTSDCVEYGQYITGIRAEGLTFSVQTFSGKLAGAVSGATSLFLLQFFGYVENVEQSSRTLNGIWMSMTLFPIVGYIAMFLIILLFYKLQEKDVQTMINKNQESIMSKE